jgi:hypothetical protein
MVRVLVCGGRDYINQDRVNEILDQWLYDEEGYPHLSSLIHGGARGADTCAARWAIDRDVPVTCYPAQWNTYGKSAGYKRNQQMLDEGKPDEVICFPGGRGTEMMKNIALKAGLPVFEIDYDDDQS